MWEESSGFRVAILASGVAPASINSLGAGVAATWGTIHLTTALKMGAKCLVFSEDFSALVAPIFIALRVSQSDMTTQLQVDWLEFGPQNSNGDLRLARTRYRRR